MNTNRSMPDAVVIPTLAYVDVRAAVTWLCDRFGFTERLQIGDHRSQLTFGTGALVVTALSASHPASSQMSYSIMVRVDDAERHYGNSVQKGVEVLNPLADFPYGERQYSARDLGGHVWTFSQSIADVDPATWGGVLHAPPGKKH
jgi:uncharacterized glyoxalase superfamily protein PhnB